jgi:Uma2 family endonuclease
LIKVQVKGTLYVPRAAIWTSRNTHLEPDLFYVSEETERQLEPTHRTTADLVVEVISPGSAIYDRHTKADTYAALGVKELWLVDEVLETVEVRVIDGERYNIGAAFEKGELRSVILPELAFNVARIFAD